MAQLNETPTRIAPPPNTDDLKTLRDYVANLAEITAKLAKDLDFIINGNLDVDNIRANSITAIALDVQELSAISANLGHITAGEIESVEIYGSKIATRKSGYPRIELSNTNDLLSAKNFNSGIYTNINIEAQDDVIGIPAIVFGGGIAENTHHRIYGVGSLLEMEGTSLDIYYNNIELGGFGKSANVRIYGTLRFDGKSQFGSITIPNSSATDVDDLRVNFNSLLSALRSMGILNS